jgi:SAM-dependent methyltransferase
MILRHVGPCAGVLDLGTYAGALLSRLQDAGFTDLHGSDLDTTEFSVDRAAFTRLDLNEDFSRHFTRRFSLITATDVIEHVDSPRNFLQQTRMLLEDDGQLAISLPNVAFWEGRAKFLLKGELWGFGDKNYRLQRHISPITFEQMTLMMQEIGLEVVECGAVGSFARPLRWVVTAPLWIPMRILGGKSTLGESALFLAKKISPDAELKDPVDYRSRWKADFSGGP